jgi:hypothetical protein
MLSAEASGHSHLEEVADDKFPEMFCADWLKTRDKPIHLWTYLSISVPYTFWGKETTSSLVPWKGEDNTA